MSPRAAESDEDVRRASTEPRLSRSEFGHPHNPRTDVRRLRFQLASTQSRLASASEFSGGRVMPGHQHRTAAVMERTFLPAPSMEGIHQSIGHFNRVNHDTTRRELQ